MRVARIHIFSFRMLSVAMNSERNWLLSMYKLLFIFRSSSRLQRDGNKSERTCMHTQPHSILTQRACNVQHCASTFPLFSVCESLKQCKLRINIHILMAKNSANHGIRSWLNRCEKSILVCKLSTIAQMDITSLFIVFNRKSFGRVFYQEFLEYFQKNFYNSKHFVRASVCVLARMWARLVSHFTIKYITCKSTHSY